MVFIACESACKTCSVIWQLPKGVAINYIQNFKCDSMPSEHKHAIHDSVMHSPFYRSLSRNLCQCRSNFVSVVMSKHCTCYIFVICLLCIEYSYRHLSSKTDIVSRWQFSFAVIEFENKSLKSLECNTVLYNMH